MEGLNLASRRGQSALDILFIVILLFVLGVTLIFVNMFLNTFNDEWQASDAQAESKAILDDVAGQHANVWDGVIVFLLIVLWGLVMVSSFLIDTHPIFFIVSVFLLIMVGIGAMVLANTFAEISEDPELSTYADNFPKLLFIMDHLLELVIVFGLSAAFALYSRSQLT